MPFRKNQVVQFNENHKWCGSIGYINQVKHLKENTRYMVGIPIPEQGTAYIFVMETDNAIEYIGEAVLVAADDEDEDN